MNTYIITIKALCTRRPKGEMATDDEAADCAADFPVQVEARTAVDAMTALSVALTRLAKRA